MTTTTDPTPRRSRARRRRFDAEGFRSAREDAGLTIRDLSELTGIPKPTLDKLQQGLRRMPRPGNYRRIILALHLPKGSLLLDDPDPGDGSDT